MADRNNHGIAVAFLILVLIMLQMVAAIKIPGSILSPKMMQKFFKEFASELPNLFESGRSYYDQSKPSNGEPSGGGGRSQAAATNASSYYSWSFTVGGGSNNPQPFSGMLHISTATLCGCSAIAPTAHGARCCRDRRGQSFYPSQSPTMVATPCTGSTCQSFVRQQCTDPNDTRCFYTYMYNGGLANTTGYLANDTFTFKSDPVPLVFGCGFYNQRDGYTSSYYVGLTGIQVDGKDLPIPNGTFDLDPTDGSGGVILSITVPLTFLHQRAYKLLKEELKSKIGLTPVNGSALGLDLCYTSRSLTMANIPAMALVFDGGNNNNAVMELQTRNYFFMDSDTGLECLTILPSSSKASLLGSLIQTGTHMIYDVRGNKLQFESLTQASPTRSDSSNNRSPPLYLSSLVVASMLYWIIAA
ncbi:hypothetical protein PR202_ga22755 [Eleusine coracana subsp. coracana]|uniref:Xylanase inhibitor C-terminal domain-containing protein n=1 Tax=Eleusine coracana subsp. coracana TaxID=191504 RepID=A0AAV5D3I1_ELECO|nr:hypothetical protein PR202_ga22755 [Eleusine coracana subsp. coracana]